MGTTRLLCWIVILSAMIAVVAGCRQQVEPRSVTAADLVGTYQIAYTDTSNRPAGSEVLVLSANGQYTQTYTSPSNKVYTNAGAWERELQGNRIHLLLLDYTSYFDANIGTLSLANPRKSATSLPVAQQGDVLRVNDDLGLAFQKAP